MKRIASLAASSAVLLGLLHGAALPASAGQVSLQQKMVWAHAMIVFPLDLDVVKPWLPEGYEGVYVSYPLDARRSYPGGRWQETDVRSAKAAGLNGFSVDIFQDGNAANGYLSAADEIGGFDIAPCLDGVNEEPATPLARRAINEQVAEVVTQWRRSAGRIGAGFEQKISDHQAEVR